MKFQRRLVCVKYEVSSTIDCELWLRDCALCKNILICGGTSSGKTTFANVLTDFIDNLERIVLIEDTAAIQIQKENVVRFEARREQNGFTSAEKRLLTEV